MSDREKVISTLEDIKTQTAEIGLDSAVIAHKFIDKILALLKEQEAKIDNKELIRCKDCKFNTGTKDKPYCVAMGREPDWFCADGKEKE